MRTHIRTLLTLLLLSLSYLIATAQSPERVKVHGALYEQSNREPLAFATVHISMSNDDKGSPYKQISDQDGSFAIMMPRATEYRVVATFMGMRTYTTVVKVPAGATSVDVGRIYMEEDATLLQEATVTASRTLVKSSIDRLSYEMGADPSVKTDNLLEALRKVPLVTIDGEGNIQIKGSGNYRIFLNGKPSNLFNQNASDVLKAIPAGSIKSVEVITDPGVKYDAEGVSAILNIITDTGQGMEGLTGTVGLNATSYPMYSSNAYLTAKKGKWGFTTNISGYKGSSPMTITETERTSATLSHKQHTESNTKGILGYIGNVLLSYEFDSLNLLNVTGAFRSFNLNTDSRMQEALSGNNYLVDYTNSMVRGASELSVDYQHSTRKPNELLTFSYHLSHEPDHNELFSERYLKGNAQPLSSTLSKGNGRQVEHTGQIDYTVPLTQSQVIEAGVKYIHRTSSSEPIYLHRLNKEAPWVESPSLPGSAYSNDFVHTYGIGAVYLSYEYRSAKVSAKAGARIEAGRLSALFDKQPSANFSKRFFEWVPQANIAYNLSPTSQLKAGYNFTIQRPSISHLNPFRLQTDDFTVQMGNPNLDAARLHKVNLDYTYYSQKLTLSLSSSYNFTDNAIEQYTYRKDNVLYSTYENIGKNRSIGLNGYIMLTPTAGVRLFTNTNLQYTHQTSDVLKMKRNVLSGSAMLGLMLTLPRDWSANINAGLFKPLMGLQTTSSFHHFQSFGISKQLLQRRLTLSASVTNPFAKYQTFAMKTQGSDFHLDVRTRFQMQSFTIGASYTFGKMRSQVAKTRRTIQNDDRAPVQQSGQPSTTPNM